MFIRWLTIVLCRSLHEMRVVKRLLRAWQRTAAEDREAMRDRTITRRLRLSLLWAVLTLSVESPQSLALGAFSMCGFLALQLWRAANYFWSLI